MPKIAILGAGIIGLSSALAIQEHLPLAAVTIIADKFSPNTTSDVAAGFIEPYLCDQEDENRLIRWTRQTISRIEEYKSEGNQGAEEISGYWMQTSPDHPKWLEVMKNVKILNEREVRDVIKEENEYRFGIFYSTWYLEPTPYLRYSARKFQKNGGKFVKKLIANIDEVRTVDDFDLLVNCTGLSSKKLFNDPTVRPIRGQILRVFCPQIRHFFIDDTTYCLPNDNCLIIGGTKEIDKWDLKVDEK